MVDVVMKGAPFFVFALLAGKLAEMAGDEPGRLVEIFQSTGSLYGLATILGSAHHDTRYFYPAVHCLFDQPQDEYGLHGKAGATSCAAFVQRNCWPSQRLLPRLHCQLRWTVCATTLV